MQTLESKQRQCLEIERNLRLKSSDSCSKKKWEKKLELNALHLRRAEKAKDCVVQNIDDAQLSESTLDSTDYSTCKSIVDSFKTSSSAASSTRRKRRSNKRRKREIQKRSTKATECRRSTTNWHKKCSALAKCCPLTEDCKVETKEIMDQIHSERQTLRDIRKSCSKRKR
ncbi:hypothetical protein WR25_06004 [Diploscapter pachys]|uniref:Uncharacterized protein n=1 Tax=Diploscapter pachys TaxID=2018661 RepID=A0A2A2LQA8_9BILA|nr:hypothetical protein WR25_06004 [Diploscapter pachys]